MSQLQKALENLMLTDPELYTKLQGSLRGIGTPAKETNQLQVGCVGQLGRGCTVLPVLQATANLRRPSRGQLLAEGLICLLPTCGDSSAMLSNR